MCVELVLQITSTIRPKEDSEHTKFDRRFYATIVLLSIVNERPIDVVERMNMKSNDVYNFQSDASLFSHTTTKFCRALNWGLLASVLESYADRLTFGVRDDLLPLVRACGPDIMHSRRAHHFYKGESRMHRISFPVLRRSCLT